MPNKAIHATRKERARDGRALDKPGATCCFLCDAMDRKSLSCSFCGRAEQEVQKLVAGPTVFICDTCVRGYTANLRRTNEQKLQRVEDGRLCSFCGKSATDTRHLAGVEDLAVCNECLNLCNDIIAPQEDDDGV